ncbi:endonuclease III [Rickettsia prowazekii]|uniref:Endonuclease III n=2 Tax=Rickettsia prowazekii TaxID=782 RepID=END3_RICPR|nr:endonuclease III [Rickettsia prowazekii]O05956.1 RecName: Full=Endonuclease III; AltName: Full=DNA-(apurinic or apyrimidinic site) lyase [Rickettsia prowazekii str. Madrid E]EOB10333.1 Endonuclease III [Rickettsia prowazekii str. GvF12]ADE30302.1 Endonuclease III [Rickettsia prowazekii str. Rp22]AFE49542.1 endonuclease III [Rickettsia prowazekii str. Chernikova]AFE50386.1 endonuclease III [Rickettsia prowazekii str. Katsinyian]AFE51231.1 endonuclease III [Rickettsia prowazekii str. BuV67-C
MQAQIMNKIFEIFSKNNPKPQTELIYKNDFTLLVAVILSARATDISVNLATKHLFETYNTPEKFLELGEEGLKKYIKSIGLFNSKAKNIIALCQILIKNYQTSIPNNFKELVKLPGVGRKTANVVLNCLFAMPTMAVDTHVFRVSKRIGLAKGNTAAIVEKELLQIIDEKWLTYAHHWLILHGRYICKARKPGCNICPIKEYCEYYINTFSS